MRKLLASLLALIPLACFGTTLSPIQLLNPSGSTSGQVIASTGASSAPAWTTVTLSGLGGLAAANNLSDLANASTARTNLGLGTAAVVNTGTSGAVIPLLSTANTWTLAQAFTVRPTFNGNTPYDSGNVVAIANGGTNAATAAAARTNLGAAASGANSDITSIAGGTAGAAAPTGAIGQWITVTGSSIAVTTSGATQSAISFSLPAGDYDVQAVIVVTPAGTTTVSTVYAAVSTSPTTLGSVGSYTQTPVASPAGNGGTFASPVTQVLIGATTTIYAATNVGFATSTCNVTGYLRFRRMH